MCAFLSRHCLLEASMWNLLPNSCLCPAGCLCWDGCLFSQFWAHHVPLINFIPSQILELEYKLRTLELLQNPSRLSLYVPVVCACITYPFYKANTHTLALLSKYDVETQPLGRVQILKLETSSVTVLLCRSLRMSSCKLLKLSESYFSF